MAFRCAVVVALSAVAAGVAVAAYLSYNNDAFLISIRNDGIRNIAALIRDYLVPTSEYMTNYFATWKSSLYDAGRDVGKAVHSGSILTYLTIQPIVYLLYLAVVRFFIGKCLFEYVILKGICSPKAIRQMQNVGLKLVQWQLSLTTKQLAIEFVVVISSIGLFHAMKFLQRRQYLRRFKRRIRRGKRAIRESYHRKLERIASISIFLANMTPHALFALLAMSIMAIIPQTCHWIATETYLVTVFHTWYPLFATIWTLLDTWIYYEDNGNGHDGNDDNNGNDATTTTPKKKTTTTRSKKSKTTATPASTSKLPPRTPVVSSRKKKVAVTTPHRPKKNRRRRSSLVSRESLANNGGYGGDGDDGGDDNEIVLDKLYDRQQYWIHYWMVSKTLTACKLFLAYIPFVMRIINIHPIISAILQQLEIVFWLWLVLLPNLTPDVLQEEPLVTSVATKVIGPITRVLNDGLSTMVTELVWNRYIVEPTSSLLQTMVWMKFIEENTSHTILHLVTEGRNMILPLVLVFSPFSFMSILYVAYILPLSKSETSEAGPFCGQIERKIGHWLQYWILHTLFTYPITFLAPILWWIPFSNVAIFSMYTCLAVILSPTKIHDVYRYIVQEELQAFQILPLANSQDDHIPFENSFSVRIFHYIIDKLPKSSTYAAASDNDDNEEDNDGMVEEEDDVYEEYYYHQNPEQWEDENNLLDYRNEDDEYDDTNGGVLNENHNGNRYADDDYGLAPSEGKENSADNNGLFSTGTTLPDKQEIVNAASSSDDRRHTIAASTTRRRHNNNGRA